MNYSNKKILQIDLSRKEFEIKTYPELVPFVGGLALGLKLAEMNKDAEDFLCFAIGPLNGLFPSVSKTCIVSYSDRARDLKTFYIGGALSSRLKFTGFDAVTLTGSASDIVYVRINPEGAAFSDSPDALDQWNLPGRNSCFSLNEKSLLLDKYFMSGDSLLVRIFGRKNIGGLVVNSTLNMSLEDFSRYEKLYKELLDKIKKLKVMYGDSPSCVECPFGCGRSQIGESEGNILAHCLVACDFVSDIYSDLGIVFSCLNALGYEYKHEDLELLPDIVLRLIKDLTSS